MNEALLPKRYIDQLPEPNPIQPQVFRPLNIISLTAIRSLPEFADESTKQFKNSLSFDCCEKEFFDPPLSKNQTLWQHHYDNQLVYMRYDLPKNLMPFPIQPIQTNPYIYPGDITFDSCFESGNLLAAYKITERQYNLVLQNDVNSKGNTQWFFFCVKNKYHHQTVRFNIINLTKEKSLYQKGLQPLVYSSCQAENGVSWHHAGMNIQYIKNNYQRSRGCHFTLSFTYTFSESNDTVYFAHSYPYTLTKLHNFLMTLQSPHILIKRLCETITGNVVHSLTITDNQMDDEKQGIVLQARQHPGETTGSFLMEGCLQFLTEETFEAQYLRKKFVFRCFPLLNPDGVVNGNYRCNLSGVDINRRWVKPSRISHPCIHAARQSVKQFHMERQISLILDFHAHSKKFNTFFYGNDCQKEKPLLDTICRNSQYFSLENSKFQVRPFQEQTARVALWKLTNLSSDVYTVETSFFGYEQMGKLFAHTINDLKNIGRDICMGIFKQHYSEPMIKPLGVKNYFASEKKSPQLKEQQTEQKSKKFEDKIDDTSMSESCPSEDELTDRSIVIKIKKKKRQVIKSRKNSQEPIVQHIQKSQNRSNSEQNYLIEKNTALPPTQLARIKRLMADTEPLLSETVGPKFVSNQVKIPQQNIERSRRCQNQYVLQNKQWQVTPQKKCFSNNNSPTNLTDKICTTSIMKKPIFQPLFKLRTRQLVQSPPLLDFSLGTIKQYDAMNASEIQTKTSKLQSRMSCKKFLQKRTSLDDSILNPLAKRFIAFMNR